MSKSPKFSARVGPFELSFYRDGVTGEVVCLLHRNQSDCSTIVQSIGFNRHVAQAMGEWLVENTKPANPEEKA